MALRSPIGFEGGDINIYRYVGNDTTVFVMYLDCVPGTKRYRIASDTVDLGDIW